MSRWHIFGLRLSSITDPDVLALTRALLRYSDKKAGKAESEASSTTDGPTDSNKPLVFCINSEGQQLAFEMAICLSIDRQARIEGQMPADSEFESSRISREDFAKRPEIVQDPHLFVRFRSRYFGWDNGSPILATLELYRTAFIESQAKAAPSKGTWKRWWGRGNNRSRTVTEESTTSTSTEQAKADAAAIAEKEAATAVTQPLLGPSLSQAETAVDEKETSAESLREDSPTDRDTQSDAVAQPKHYAKTLRLTSDQLKALNLKKGANTVSFTVQSSFSGVAVITSRIFLWEADRQVVISDIDGTITK